MRIKAVCLLRGKDADLAAPEWTFPGEPAPQIVHSVFDSLRRGRGCSAPAGAAKGRRPLESRSLCKGWRNFYSRFAPYLISLPVKNFFKPLDISLKCAIVLVA